MTIVGHISRMGVPIADVTYRAGLHVEVRVAKGFQNEKIYFELSHSGNGPLTGTWESALDEYFNFGCFDSKDGLLRGEMRRVGAARDHKSLFRIAIHALMKDLGPYGYEVEVEFI
ncbi:MAG: hypothetical protein RDU20_11710 [Desulfomonilaceae bacterium]|nr:hypothetical protein [Desulfomonilaceae bacterium]